MRKLLPLLIAIALLASCAAPTPEPGRADPEPDTPVAAPDTPGEPEVPPEPPQPAYEPGQIEGAEYRSGYFSLAYTLPEGWAWSENANENGLSTDFEMFAYGDEGLQNLSFNAEEGDAETVLRSYLADLPQALEDAGFENALVEELEIPLAGRGCGAVKVSAEVEVAEGVVSPVFVLAVFTERDGRCGEFTATSFAADATEEIIKGVTG